MTLDVKILWFGRQVAVCVQKRHNSAIFGCSWFQKFNFDCLLLKLLICSPTTENIFKFVCPLLTQSFIMILGTQVYFTLFFGYKSQIMTLSQKFQKSDFLGHCSFKPFHDVEKLRRKPKIFVKVIRRFWYVQHVGLIFEKIHQKRPKLQLQKSS